MRLRPLAAAALVALGALAMSACASGAPGDGPTPPMSSSDLPIAPRPTAPPTAPSDPQPSGTIAGRVIASADGCIDVRTDDDVVWSLVGDADVGFEVGDVVVAETEPLDGDAACGAGSPVRLVSLRVVGG